MKTGTCSNCNHKKEDRFVGATCFDCKGYALWGPEGPDAERYFPADKPDKPKPFIKTNRMDDVPVCATCNIRLDRDGEVDAPARGKMTFFKCSKCGQKQMLFKPIKQNQQLATCGECRNYYRKGHFANKAEDNQACGLFQEEI